MRNGQKSRINARDGRRGCRYTNVSGGVSEGRRRREMTERHRAVSLKAAGSKHVSVHSYFRRNIPKDEGAFG